MLSISVGQNSGGPAATEAKLFRSAGFLLWLLLGWHRARRASSQRRLFASQIR